MKHLEVNKRTDEETKREELAILDQKHEGKSMYVRLKPLAYFCKWSANVFQFNSFFFAALGSASYIWFQLGTSGIPFIILIIVMYALVEYGVNVGFSTFGSMKFDDKRYSKVIYVFLTILLLISTPTTYFATPYAIRLVTPTPVLIDTSMVRTEQDILIKTDTSYWSGKKVEKMNAVAAYWKVWKKKGEDRVSSAKHVKNPFEALKSKVIEMQDSVNAYLAYGQSRKAFALTAAIQENKETVKAHLDWCSSFGWILAAISGIGVILLIPCRMFYEWWERYYRKDLQGSVASKVEETGTRTEEVRKEEEPEVIEEDRISKDKLENEGVKNMQFAMSGKKVEEKKDWREYDIKGKEGRKSPRIYGYVDGSLRALKIGDINKHIRVNSTSKESSVLPYYKDLKKRLENFKAK